MFNSYSHLADPRKATTTEDDKIAIPVVLKAHPPDNKSAMLCKDLRTFRASGGTRTDDEGELGDCHLILTIDGGGGVTCAEIAYTREEWKNEGPLEGFSVAIVEAKTTKAPPQAPKRKRQQDDDDEQTATKKKDKKDKKKD